jgi:hypothetical protein
VLYRDRLLGGGVKKKLFLAMLLILYQQLRSDITAIVSAGAFSRLAQHTSLYGRDLVPPGLRL